MAKIRIRGVPRNLPHARIYLDDLEEIQSFILGAYQRLYPEAKISFTYRDKNNVFTEIRDLRDDEGFASSFSVRVKDESESNVLRYVPGPTELQIGGWDTPTFSAPGFSEGEQRALFSQVHQVFASRQSKLKTFLRKVPFGLWCALYLGGLLSPNLIPSGTRFRAGREVSFLLFGAVILATITLGFVATRKDGIFFRDSRRDQKQRRANLRAQVEKVLWLIGGAAITLTVQWISKRRF